MKDLSVVILNFNGRKFLEQFLPSFISHSGDAEIIVADNASTDDSIQYLESNFSKIRLIKLEKNYGFSEGYNIALKQIDSKYYAIVNSDIQVTKNWFNPLKLFLEKNSDYASVQPKIKNFNIPQAFEYAGAAGGFVDMLGYPYCRGRLFDHIENDQGQYEEQVDVEWTSGACFIIRSDIFHQMGGFDVDFFAHMEEIDLCWRLRSNGWKLACIPESIVYHVGAGTLSKTSPLKTYLNFRNSLLLLLKNLPLQEIIWKIPMRLILDGIAAIKFFFELSPIHALAIIKAQFHFYIRINKTMKKRKKTCSPHKISILWNYYVKGKKKFSAL